MQAVDRIAHVLKQLHVRHRPEDLGVATPDLHQLRKQIDLGQVEQGVDVVEARPDEIDPLVPVETIPLIRIQAVPAQVGAESSTGTSGSISSGRASTTSTPCSTCP